MSKATAALGVGASMMAALLTVGLPHDATAGVHVAQALTPTSHAPNARGRAKLALKSASKGRFRVLARRLAPQASFDLVVGGVKVGTFTTNRHGSGQIQLSTHPKPSQGLLGVDPRGKSIEVRDDNGDDDLEGEMPDDDGDSAAGAFACCASDDGEMECEVETPDE